MKLILFSGIVDILLTIIFRLMDSSAGHILLIMLAAVNILFYLGLLIAFLRKTARQPERKGFLLEFVFLQFFLCAGIFLFKLTDLIIQFNGR